MGDQGRLNPCPHKMHNPMRETEIHVILTQIIDVRWCEIL